MASLTNVKSVWSGTTETVTAIEPYKVPMGGQTWWVYADLRQVGGSTVPAGGDSIAFNPNLPILGAFGFQYSVVNSTNIDAAATTTVAVDTTTNVITFNSVRGTPSKNRVGVIVVTR